MTCLAIFVRKKTDTIVSSSPNDEDNVKPMPQWSEIYWGVPKVAQLLLSHRFGSGLCSRMKLHTAHFQYVFDKNMNFQLNLTRFTELADVSKESVQKSGIVSHCYY